MHRSGTAGIDAPRGRRAAVLLSVPFLLTLVSLACLLSAPASGAAGPRAEKTPPPDTLASRIARRYGLDAFGRIEALHYVFRLRAGERKVDREWTWYPRRDSVEYRGPGPDGKAIQKAFSYSRRDPSSMGAPGTRSIDAWFVNDQYWLLFPYHLAWDRGIRLESAAADGQADFRLTVTYPPEGGYTPGDAYDLFVDSAGTIRSWAFRKGAAEGEGRPALWSEPVPVGPLRLSLERSSPDSLPGGFRIRFEDVKAVTAAAD